MKRKKDKEAIINDTRNEGGVTPFSSVKRSEGELLNRSCKRSRRGGPNNLERNKDVIMKDINVAICRSPSANTLEEDDECFKSNRKDASEGKSFDHLKDKKLPPVPPVHQTIPPSPRDLGVSKHQISKFEETSSFQRQSQIDEKRPLSENKMSGIIEDNIGDTKSRRSSTIQNGYMYIYHNKITTKMRSCQEEEKGGKIYFIPICCFLIVALSLLNAWLGEISYLSILPLAFLHGELPQARHFLHVIPPTYSSMESSHDSNDSLSDLTLRQFLSNQQGFHLALGPAFFGYFAYFGVLSAFQEKVLLPQEREEGNTVLPVLTLTADGKEESREPLLKSVSGASAGAMAAVLIASGLNPRESAEFASSITLGKFADPIGLGGILKGELFQEIMVNRLKSSTASTLQNGIVPVAVTGYDILSMETKILTEGCMGRAARASATFPGLFQPVVWVDTKDKYSEKNYGNYFTRLKQKYMPYFLLIDGGVTDHLGLLGLSALLPNVEKKRVVSITINGFGIQGPLGPSKMPEGLHASEVVSISIENSPACGPWAMENGSRAVQAARESIYAVLDLPMYKGREDNHYILHVDAEAFIPE